MKDIELRLVSELMKNSRRSDRELAKALKVSQPTVSRMIKKLEKEGYFKEYTVIPDFAKLGYGLLTVTFIKHRSNLGSNELPEIEKRGMEQSHKGASPEVVMAERGMGLGYDGIIIAYEKDYSAYLQLLDRMRKFEHLAVTDTRSFIIDLSDKVHYRSFTYSMLANHLLTMIEQK